MANKDDDFLKRLRATFMAEADEHIRAITAGLLELEKTPSAERQAPLLDGILREAHSLKGAARSVDIPDVEEICQVVESIFSALKKRTLDKTPALFDTLHQAMDMVEKIINVREGTAPPVSGLLKQLRSLARGDRDASVRSGTGAADRALHREVAAATPSPTGVAAAGVREFGPASEAEGSSAKVSAEAHHSQKSSHADTVRISAAKLDSLMLQAEEMISLKAAAVRHLEEIRGAAALAGECEKETAKAFAELQNFMGSFEGGVRADRRSASVSGMLNRGLGRIRELDAGIQDLLKTAGRDYAAMNGMIDDLVEGMKKAVMLPFSALLEGLPKMVREISREQGKRVELSVSGSGIEVDKRILQELKDPLLHILRNCIDHGIESPEGRIAGEKPEHGNIRIRILQRDSNRLEMLVSDDGSGIDLEKVKLAAVDQGIVKEGDMEGLDEHEALALIFRTGISTSPIITTLSGRGLGMAIVKERVERLGGGIHVTTTPGLGTTFRFLLPLTLATFRGIVAVSSGQVFVVPTMNVERALRVRHDEIRTIENRETIFLGGRAYSLVRLSDVLEIGPDGRASEAPNFIPVLLLGTSDDSIAFAVDEIVGEREVLLKGLGRQLARVRNIAGAAILGSGKPAAVLNVSDLLKSAVKAGAITAATGRALAGHAVRRKSILVAEDSITARTLFKNILESAGYRVRTAVDGLDALAAVKEEPFDLVVSDVQMPRVNGFELTERIRADAALSSIPVVLITGLEAREDRERGIDVGADAYIVKSSFEQGNLLEVISRLI